MPQKPHYIVPVHHAVAGKFSRYFNGESVREGNMPQKLHHIVPVYRSVLIHVSGNIAHHFYAVGRRHTFAGNADRLRAQLSLHKACCFKALIGQPSGAVAVDHLQLQAGGVQRFLSQIQGFVRHHGNFQRLGGGSLRFPCRIEDRFSIFVIAAAGRVNAQIAVFFLCPAEEHIAFPYRDLIGQRHGLVELFQLKLRRACTAIGIKCNIIGIQNPEAAHAGFRRTGCVGGVEPCLIFSGLLQLHSILGQRPQIQILNHQTVFHDPQPEYRIVFHRTPAELNGFSHFVFGLIRRN